jgi:hypothetical protein
MNCLVFEGTEQCLWCRSDRDTHPYRWCRRCHGDLTTPDPTDREAQLAGRPTWAWRQHPCACRHGIVTLAGRKLTEADLSTLQAARKPLQQSRSDRYLPFNET